MLFTLIISAVLSLLDNFIGTFNASTGTGLLGGIFSLAILIPTIAVSVRRLHNIGRTGWWVLIGLIPVIGTIVLLVFAITNSEAGTNQYGTNPKAALA